MKAVNPLAVLTRGYSITSDERGHVLRSVRDVRAGQRLFSRLSDGRVESTAATASGEVTNDR
jgi:exodeoxyribonuclease VII large subunit